MSKLSVERRNDEGQYFMSQEQEYAVIGRTIEQRNEAERTFKLLSDEIDDAYMKLLSLASDLRSNPEKVTGKRVEELARLHILADSFTKANSAFREADKRAAKWLPDGIPRPVFDSTDSALG